MGRPLPTHGARAGGRYPGFSLLVCQLQLMPQMLPTSPTQTPSQSLLQQ